MSATEVTPNEFRAPVILLIENDPNDVFLFRRALARAGYQGDVRVVGTATEARAYMENTAPFKDPLYFRQPSLIVSDFRLVGHTALDFLRWLQCHPVLEQIPLIMLSGVSSGVDPNRLADIRVASFVQKSADIGALAAALHPFLPRLSA